MDFTHVTMGRSSRANLESFRIPLFITIMIIAESRKCSICSCRIEFKELIQFKNIYFERTFSKFVIYII